MEVKELEIPGVFLLQPQIHGDERGYFVESFNQKTFEKGTGLSVNFVQDNQSKSKKGVLRGLHFQREPYAQAKLVRVLQGEVLDIILDLRAGSPTYGKHLSVHLNDRDMKQLFVPRGLAHGFVTLKDDTIFFYKCDNYYSKEHEGGVLFNDPALEVDWVLELDELIISEKDKINPTLNESETYFSFQK